jgi:hypothetical protein
MNAFLEHHKDNIRFRYRCFDRILLHGCIQTLLDGARALGFFWTHRHIYPVSRDVLRGIASQYHNWVQNRSKKWQVEIVKDIKEDRRDTFVKPYFQRAQPDQVVTILKAREPAGIMIAIGDKQKNKWHLEIKHRWVDQYNFYLRDAQWGPMFVRVCPYFPFSVRICLNQHNWLAQRLQKAGIRFTQTQNAFRRCQNPEVLQQFADSLSPEDLITCGNKWVRQFVPFFTPQERREHACWHRLFFAQVEYCDNLIFRRRAALDELGERLLDSNRDLGKPNKLTVIFGRKITRRYRGKLQTEIEDLHLGNPVMRSYYKNGFAKHYVRDHDILRFETATNNVSEDYGIKKSVENLAPLREKLQGITERYQNVQQDILETFLDRGELRTLGEPTVLANGKRIPGLKLDHPRQLALMHSLVRFSHVAASDTFTTKEIHAQAAEALGVAPQQYSLASVRYELSKLRAKGLVEKLPHSRRYRLLPNGYRICLVFLKLFEKIYAPLTAGLLHPYPGDRHFPTERLSQLDRLYQQVVTALDDLVMAVGLKVAA